MSDLVEGLSLFDEPMLNSRYHALLLRRDGKEADAELARLPGIAIECTRLAREGAARWEETRATPQTDAFFVWAEHAVMDAFLQLSESQLRVAAHLARIAPTSRARAPFDGICERHREISRVLRAALKGLPRATPEAPAYRRNVQEEDPEGDFRGQLERATHVAEASGAGVRLIVVSPTGLRHLRDQGCFQDGAADFEGYPVSVDMGWDAPAFAIETYDRVSLDELLHPDPSDRDAKLPPSVSAPGTPSPG